MAKTDRTHGDARPQRAQQAQQAQQGRNSARARQSIHLLLFFLAVVLVVGALVGDRGLLASRRADRQYEEVAASTKRQLAENERLREEKRRLEEDPAAIEEVARRELGLIRPGEKLFIIRDVTAPPPR